MLGCFGKMRSIRGHRTGKQHHRHRIRGHSPFFKPETQWFHPRVLEDSTPEEVNVRSTKRFKAASTTSGFQEGLMSSTVQTLAAMMCQARSSTTGLRRSAGTQKETPECATAVVFWKALDIDLSECQFFKADSDRSSTTRLRGQLGPGKGCSFSATAVVLGICVLTFCSAQESGASQWLFFRLDVFLVRKIIFSMFFVVQLENLVEEI